MNFFRIAIFLSSLMGIIASADEDHDGKLSGQEKLNLATKGASLIASQFGLSLSGDSLQQIIDALVKVFNLIVKPKK